MIPNTLHGLRPHDCVSAMQKFLRRGMEREAMEMACEMGHSSKGFASWVCRRLQIIAIEDVGLAAPEVITLVRTCCDLAKEWYSEDSLGEWRMAVGTAVRALARAPKSREGDHFQAAVVIPMLLDNRAPDVPDWTKDMHTAEGKAKGRGLDYFRDVSTQLVPDPGPDPYQAEAYEAWRREREAKGCKKRCVRPSDKQLF